MCKHILIRDFNASTDLDILKDFVEKTYDNDGYGVIARLKDNRIVSLKSMSEGYLYLWLYPFLNKIDELVIHYRTSTNKDGVDYAHPFFYEGNYLTHNGVVNVPGKHETNTTNDSEQLLHHLIKTNYETLSIQGYFSCFVLNDDTTTILVDDTAPMYTNGRIFSSHKLNDSWESVRLSKIVFSKEGKAITPIEVTKSTYGLSQASASLGWSVEEGYPMDGYKDIDYTQLDMFFKYISSNQEYLIASQPSIKKMKKQIKKLSKELFLDLNDLEIEDIVDYYLYDRKAMA